MFPSLHAHSLPANNNPLVRTRECSTSNVLRPVRASAMQSEVQAGDPTNSFRSQCQIEGSRAGPLAGMTLAVKDIFDIAGHKTSFGNPAWIKTHPPANHTALAVQKLLAAGAALIGKTHLDELAFGSNGENEHYGTPVNVAAPGRIPGGSSSGSAAAVAAGQADIGLGTDTGGSVRVPASYCGICCIRPTHGRVPLEHVIPMAESLDTVGWFTRDPTLLQSVGQVLLSNPTNSKFDSTPRCEPRWLVGKDAFALALPETSKALYKVLSGDGIDAVRSVLGRPMEVDIAAGLGKEGLGKLELWMNVFRVILGYEVWQSHRAWITQHSKDISPSTLDRFNLTSKVTKAEYTAAIAKRQLIKQHLDQLLGRDGVLAVPTTVGPAVPLNTPAGQLDDCRRFLLCLTCIAGLAGLPQVTLPLAQVDGLPVGCSLIGPAGKDEWLLELAVKLTAALRQPTTATV